MPKKDEPGSGDLPPLMEVTCVSRAVHEDLRQGGQAIGGIRDGVTWKLGQADAIAAIVAGDARFFVRTARGTTAVVVAVDDGGRGYLKARGMFRFPRRSSRCRSVPKDPEACRPTSTGTKSAVATEARLTRRASSRRP